MRAHPPKVTHFMKMLKINKKEINIAFVSALSATASEKYVFKKYSTLNTEKDKIHQSRDKNTLL